MLRIILVLAAALSPKAIALPELVVPFSAEYLNSNHPVFDSVVITSTLLNKGSTGTPALGREWPVFSIFVDTIMFRYHNLPVGYVLNAGAVIEYRDTIVTPKSRFTLSTWVDMRSDVEEINEYNNIRSKGFDFHPIKDTLIVRDTIRIRDTVKYCPPTLAKASQSIEDYRMGPGMDAMGRATKLWARCRE